LLQYALDLSYYTRTVVHRFLKQSKLVDISFGKLFNSVDISDYTRTVLSSCDLLFKDSQTLKVALGDFFELSFLFTS
jgi:hypothetical protein